jgi:hypothetical protein
MSLLKNFEAVKAPTWREKYGFTGFGDFPLNDGPRYVPYGMHNAAKNPYSDYTMAATRREHLGRIDESHGVEKVYDASERGITQTLHPTLRTIEGLAGFGDLLSDPVGTIKTFWTNHPYVSIGLIALGIGLSTGAVQGFMEKNFPEPEEDDWIED